MKILTIKNECTGCGACSNVCPVSAVTMQYDDEGFYYPSVDHELCIDCEKCESVCHILVDEHYKLPTEWVPYMCRAKDENIRKTSSSGGVFALLAQIVLSKKGVVFGARYNYEAERLEHDHTEHAELSDFKKSKYIESHTKNTFNEVKKYLNEGRYVLYTGAPCQIIGLKTFLRNKDTTKLLLVDFICHGVPSNKHFTEYKHYLEKKKKSRISTIDFRPKDKKNGLALFGLRVIFLNGKLLIEQYKMNLYFFSFLKNKLLRKSCYYCNIAKYHHSDITLGDFWGVASYKPQVDDNKGISLVSVNTEMGKIFYSLINDKMIEEKLPLSAVEYAYKDRNYDEYNLKDRDLIAKKVKTNGYVITMKQLLGRDIKKNKTDYYIIKAKKLIKKFTLLN